MLSIVESVLENPGVVLAAQLDRLRTETIARLKREGVEYEQRMAELDKLEHPKPLRDFTYGLFDAYATEHPWVVDHTIRPKSVARDLYERAMTFTDYVGHYGLARSEGLVLRYLTDAYKGLVQNVPEDAKTDDLLDLTEWLGELVRQVDSSLLDEWETLRHPDVEAADGATAPVRPALAEEGRRGRGHRQPAGVPADGAQRAVPLGRAAGPAGVRRPGRAAARARPGRPRPWRRRWPPTASGTTIGIGRRRAGAELFQVVEAADGWTVRQALDDPSGDRDWAIARAGRPGCVRRGRAGGRRAGVDRP